MYSDRTETNKNHPRENLPDKRPPDKTPGQKPPRTIETEFVQGAFVWIFCTRPSKNRGGPRCVTYFRGGGPGVTGQNIPPAGVYPGILWPRPIYTPGYILA